VASSWVFLSTLNYDARSTTHQIHKQRLHRCIDNNKGGVIFYIAKLLRLFQAHCIGNCICFLLKRAPNYVGMIKSDYGKRYISEQLCSENPRRKKVFEIVVDSLD